jgi:hypothetical protein
MGDTVQVRPQSSVKYVNKSELAQYETAHIQATIRRIEDWDENLTISAVYCPPLCLSVQWNSSLQHVLLVGGGFKRKTPISEFPIKHSYRLRIMQNSKRKYTRSRIHGSTYVNYFPFEP